MLYPVELRMRVDYGKILLNFAFTTRPPNLSILASNYPTE